jgi:hypothetical protein
LDGRIFDQLTRAVNGTDSRRGTLKLIAGAALAAAVATISPVAARKHGKGKHKGHKKNKKCRQLNLSCSGKKQCCPGLTCTNGTCQQPQQQAACTANSDCGAGQICVGGSCVQQPPPQPECTVDSDCAAGKICVNGSCVVPPPECTINNDCGIDEICESGHCVLIECPGGDDDCDGNELCVEGFCECPELEDGRCIRRCESQTDCPGASHCQNLAPEQNPFIVDGVCVDQPVSLCNVDRCETNDDCQSDEVCVMQDCDGAVLVGVCYPFSVF